MNPNRFRLLQAGKKLQGPVLYWMSREQRVSDNWALITAIELAEKNSTYVIVAFSLVPDFHEAGIRQYGFLLKGLQQVERALLQYNIPFLLLTGLPHNTLPPCIAQYGVSHIVTDFDPLRTKRIWKRELAKKIQIPFIEVDAHNIVPCLLVSQKEEFAAYTIRPKIHRMLPEYLDDFPQLIPQEVRGIPSFATTDWQNVEKALTINHSIKEVQWIKPGENAAWDMLQNFIHNKIHGYAEKRNDPVLDAQSNLSPYLHFGQIAAQRIVLEVRKSLPADEDTENFLEELIVRRELADNFCYYNTQYDSTSGFHPWAKATLDAHRGDKREYLYSLKQFENAQTHDRLWNAAQTEIVKTGKMHGYLRMYWAKKILEWTESPESALSTAIYLNDVYGLDGRDPNGYNGCAWSVGGVHDRAWTERPVFGKIRFMNYNGCNRKFSIEQYIAKVNNSGF